MDAWAQRLGEVHEMARRFAQGLAQLDRVTIDPATVETNIVRFELKDLDAASFVEEIHRQGVYMLPSGPSAVRAVFYLDIAQADADQALSVVSEALRALSRTQDELAGGASHAISQGTSY